MKIIAYIRTDFPEKFGIPRQSGLVEELTGTIVFEPEYRDPRALKGLEDYDYLWLLWAFEGTNPDKWNPTVRPPRLGGNTHMGVFATRSPFRPNPIGLSCVHLDGVENTKEYGTVIHVSGIDMRDKTPIYDIKPYLSYVDAHPQARSGFGAEHQKDGIEVVFPEELLQHIPKDKRQALQQVLRQDPRPAYQNDSNRRYGIAFDHYDIRFYVKNNCLYVCRIYDRMTEEVLGEIE